MGAAHPSTMPPDKLTSFGQNTAFGHPAQPLELAKLFVVLASDDGSTRAIRSVLLS
jgi:hypothetical protein